jgi:hypothetical protein
VNKYGWIDQLLNGLRDQAPERSEQERERMEQWISERIAELRRERDIK